MENDFNMSRLKKRLFPIAGASHEASASESSLRDDNVTTSCNIGEPDIAVTVNPDPFNLMNKRQYKLYDHDKQRAMLMRIETAMRRENPEIELIELHFEICPVLKQIHFHALYRCPLQSIKRMENYFEKRIKRTNSPSWRAFVHDPVFDKDGWLKYIRKNING